MEKNQQKQLEILKREELFEIGGGANSPSFFEKVYSEIIAGIKDIFSN